MFSLDHWIEGFYAQARSDPVLGPATIRFRGLRLPRDSGVWEALVHSVVGQQLSVPATNVLKQRLIALAETYREVDGIELPYLPPPADIARIGLDSLLRLGMSTAKARTLLALAAHGGSLDWESERLASSPLEAAIAELDARPGIGRWTAENTLLRGTGRTDVFVGGDLGVLSALRRFGAPKAAGSEVAARRWALQRYPGWGSYVTLYLWRRWVVDGGRRV
jgi:3-methyladenine DNA glycosylase/8-oxoguanine DNA glycosylase